MTTNIKQLYVERRIYVTAWRIFGKVTSRSDDEYKLKSCEKKIAEFLILVSQTITITSNKLLTFLYRY